MSAIVINLRSLALLALLSASATAQVMDDPPAWLNELNNFDTGTRKEEHVCRSGTYLGKVSSTIYSGSGNNQSGAKYSFWGRNSPFTCPDTDDGIYSEAFGWSWDNYDGGIAVCVHSDVLGVLGFTSFNWVGTATGGLCAGLTPVEAGVQDTDSSQQVSVRLTGTGCARDDFAWVFDGENGNLGNTPNQDQEFDCYTEAPTPIPQGTIPPGGFGDGDNSVTTDIIPGIIIDTDSDEDDEDDVRDELPSGGVEGDPHFHLWNSHTYDFMGACDLQLIHAPRFAGKNYNKPLTINVRTKIRYQYSYIESAVVKIGDDLLEVGSYGDYFLNGVSGAKGHHSLGQQLAGFAVEHTNPQKHLHLFRIKISDDPREGEMITLKVYKDMVSVNLSKAHQRRFEGSLGMMGEFGTGRMLARDGTTVLSMDDPVAIAAEWQVLQDEPVLFQTVSGPQHPQQCQLPKTAAVGKRLGAGLVQEKATAACQQAGVSSLEDCVHDVLATGDLDLAAASTY